MKELDLATTVNSINATLANLKLTTDKLNSTDNSIGLLLNDKGLYDNLNSTMDNALSYCLICGRIRRDTCISLFFDYVKKS